MNLAASIAAGIGRTATDPTSAPRPVFVVGSPRSGTSILTWCLGQHSNLLPLEESAWMGEFSTDIGVRHRLGSQRAQRSQLSAMQIDNASFFGGFGAALDRLVLQHRDAFEAHNLNIAATETEPAHPAFALARAPEHRKARWVNGTPEYSLHICGLAKLFPHARFIHIVREVEDVVASMLHFRNVAATDLVLSASDAYDYWLRTVHACLDAERALGPGYVHRLRHADLIDAPEPTLARLLAFLGEAYEPACIEPLQKRINSSLVPADFCVAQDAVAPAVRQAARALSAELQSAPAPFAATAAVRVAFDEAFEQRIEFVAALDAEYGRAQTTIERLNAEIEERNRWAFDLDAEVAGMRRTHAELLREVELRTAWARRIEREYDEKCRAVLRLQQRINGLALLLCVQLLLGTALLARPGAIGDSGMGLLLVGLGLTTCAALAYAWSRRAGLQRLGARLFRALPSP